MNVQSIGNGQLNQIGMKEKANTLDCMHDQQMILIEEEKCEFIQKLQERYVQTAIREVIQGKMPSMTCSQSLKIPLGGGTQQRLTQTITKEQEREMEMNGNTSSLSGRKYVLRRLTPVECLRLQGLPDNWCDGAEGSDSAIYKMAGNGIAIPNAADVLGRIAEELRREE